MAETQKSAPGNGGGLTSDEMDREIARLKSDLAQLSEHVTSLLNATGSHASRSARDQLGRARSKVDDALAGASDMGGEAAEAAREVRDTLTEAIEESVQTRPLATLAMVLALGFVVGAVWRR